MAITKADFSAYIKSFQFRELFNEMGWNNDRTKQTIILNEVTYDLTAIAEKSGFRIFICEPAIGNKLPDSSTRKKIESKSTKLFQEHLIIFIDRNNQEQVWQLAVRKAGSPTKISETRYSVSQDPELLYQRTSGLFFTLDEEEKVTIVDVTKRVADNFQQNNERVTKKFYESFKKEYTAFLNFIKGIDDQLNMDWYASLMLNRLMFCYFIQKKGFLDNNKNYLQDKLKACKEKKGKNKFYSFYCDFLLALFHKGIGAPEHSKSLEVEIGKIPYLNGGLFNEHEIEKNYNKIAIEDKAFEKLFNFFDQYEWHLDIRETASGRDINPDVIGYIFEKYINDRAQMGAYYTKEDITDYLSKNCIIPWLFDETKRQYPKVFEADGWLWRMVKESGDEYIYDAVKYGVPERGGLFDDLPVEIQKGFAPELERKVVDGDGHWLWELRKEWNKPAPSDIALPTETYREVIERRKRYADIKSKISNGEIKEINDFITYNLNIRQFAQDVIETTEDAEFIRYFYKALSTITILDLTCGSGAFLFAALNILEPLYEACIQRMKNFIDESGKGKHKFFEDMLTQVKAPEHTNLQYFILKSIILNNLYGVDIMNEAVEITKLRLFLKLVATVEADYKKPNFGLEPLPDVDFNIRAGNTLVGYATEEQLKDAFVGKLDFDNDAEKIKEKCDIVGHAFSRYKEIQLQGNTEFEDFKTAKDDLNHRLDKLRDELNVLLHKQHYANVKFDQWLATHQPFHWFAEFYEIVQGKGGFDVVIGNPPYVELKKIDYKLLNYLTYDCGNLYALVIERYFFILKSSAKSGMIVPHSSICTDRMSNLIKILKKHGLWLSSYDIRPSKLFDGVDQRLLIYITSQTDKSIITSNYHRWADEYREHLFNTIEYINNSPTTIPNSIIKASREIEKRIYGKVDREKPLSLQIHNSGSFIYFHNAPRYFIRLMNKPPYFWNEKDGQKISTQVKRIGFSNKKEAACIGAVLNSSLFYWWFAMFSDSRHLNSREIEHFKFNIIDNEVNYLSNIFLVLNKDFNKNKYRKETYYKATGKVIYDEYYPKLSKPIIDQIDCLLAEHYGFTHGELDFIINYDIKYRMGKELDSGEDVE